jgi:hypothetical protein
MRHLDEALTVKDDNLHMQIEAFAQEKELVAMAKAAAKGDPETWLSSITFETVGSGPGEDEEGEEGEGEEGEGEEDE